MIHLSFQSMKLGMSPIETIPIMTMKRLLFPPSFLLSLSSLLSLLSSSSLLSLLSSLPYFSSLLFPISPLSSPLSPILLSPLSPLSFSSLNTPISAPQNHTK
jgi:hypothetical protein